MESFGEFEKEICGSYGADSSNKTICYAKFGIHRYNMIHGKELAFSSVGKLNIYSRPVYSIYSMTLVAKDLASGGSLVPFQTKIFAERYQDALTCDSAKPILQPKEEEKPVNKESVEREVEFVFPEWPLENAFQDGSRYHLVKKSELQEYDWIRLYMELAFLKNNADIEKPKLSRLDIVKVAVETDDNVEQPNERLKARNATFYIKYKYRNRSPPGRIGKPPPYRFAIVRRTVSKTTGLLKLVFDHC